MKAVALRKLRSALALALALWCAGAGCMVVSYARAAAQSGDDATTIGTGFGRTSGSMGAHSCCKARHSAKRRSASSTNAHTSSDLVANLTEFSQVPNSTVMNCCPLTSGGIVVAGRQRTSNEDASVASAINSVSSFHKVVATTPGANSLRLPNQSHTYLRGCVFLI
jgi:hypothetical protein